MYFYCVTILPVMPSREAIAAIRKALHRFRTDGPMAEPVILGSHGRPEAVIIPFELYSSLLPAIEDIEMTQIVRDLHSEQGRSLDDLAADLGLNATEYD